MSPKPFDGVTLLAAAALGLMVGCKQFSRPLAPMLQTKSESAATSTATASAQAYGPTPQSTAFLRNGTSGPVVDASNITTQLEDVEERRGPFSLGGQVFTAVLHYKHLPGKTGQGSQALASLDVLDAAGTVQYREAFSFATEDAAFVEDCSIDIQLLSGTNGKGLLLDTGCEPSAPMSGGPWRVLGLINGKLVAFGKPIVTEGQRGDFKPGAANRIGQVTQILPDVLNIRVWTGYFFASVPLRVDWLHGELALAQHCFYQTGRGMAEGGCEMPAEDAELRPRAQDMTFVRLFPESNDAGLPAHVVVQKSSKLELLAGKALIRWEEQKEFIHLGVGDDVWIKVRIDGKEGWIHTVEDLAAIGLYQSG